MVMKPAFSSDEHIDIGDRMIDLFAQSSFSSVPTYDAARMAVVVDILQQNGVPCRLLQRTLDLVDPNARSKAVKMEIYLIEHHGLLYATKSQHGWDDEQGCLGNVLGDMVIVGWDGAAIEVDCRDPELSSRTLIHWEREGLAFDQLVARTVSAVKAAALATHTPDACGDAGKARPRI